MFRYLILIGDMRSHSDALLQAQVRGLLRNSWEPWLAEIDRPGFYVAHIGKESSHDSTILLPERRGAILGKLFVSPNSPESAEPSRVSTFCQSEAEEILVSKGRWLSTRCWGRYVAAIHYPESSSAIVIRSPVSPLPCFHVRLGSFNVFFSSVQDFIALKLCSLSINWDCITAQVVGGDYLTRETGVSQIEAMESGDAIECSPEGCKRHIHWNPHIFLKDRCPDNFSQIARTLRSTVDYSINALSQTHKHVLLNLSGGLDSSIVLSALKRAGHEPSITAVNYHSRGCGDERPYARSMAQSAKCRLIELPRNSLLSLERFHECNLTVRPALSFSAPDIEARNIDLAREIGASAILDGELGDNIFGRQPGPGSLVECFQRYGFGRKFLAASLDYGLLTKQSLWRSVTLAWKERRSVARYPDFHALSNLQNRYGVAAARSLILASAEAEVHHATQSRRFTHPWMIGPRRYAPGSARLISGLIAVTSPLYHSSFASTAAVSRVSPLISQPLAELALKIPSYMHSQAGQDRSLARAAFAEVLPDQILNRGIAKGGPDLWAKDVLENNVLFLREFLLDGILVQRGLLDKNKLETVFANRVAKSTAMVGDIFAKLYIETWVRGFSQIETAAVEPYFSETSTRK